MKNFITTLLSKVFVQKLPVLMISIGGILSSVSIWYRAYFAKYLADPTGEIALLMTTLSVVLIFLLVATYLWFKPRLKFDKHLQIYTDTKTGDHYCVSCKDGHKRMSRLLKRDTYWSCSLKECRMSYNNPDFVVPDEPKSRKPAYG